MYLFEKKNEYSFFMYVFLVLFFNFVDNIFFEL